MCGPTATASNASLASPPNAHDSTSSTLNGALYTATGEDVPMRPSYTLHVPSLHAKAKTCGSALDAKAHSFTPHPTSTTNASRVAPEPSRSYMCTRPDVVTTPTRVPSHEAAIDVLYAPSFDVVCDFAVNRAAAAVFGACVGHQRNASSSAIVGST